LARRNSNEPRDWLKWLDARVKSLKRKEDWRRDQILWTQACPLFLLARFPGLPGPYPEEVLSRQCARVQEEIGLSPHSERISTRLERSASKAACGPSYRYTNSCGVVRLLPNFKATNPEGCFRGQPTDSQAARQGTVNTTQAGGPSQICKATEGAVEGIAPVIGPCARSSSISVPEGFEEPRSRPCAH
jgi:hypothetical protein